MYFRITKSALDSGGREYLPQSVLIQCRHICTACSVFLVLHIFGRKTSVSKKIYQVHLCTRNTVFNITIYSVLLSFLGVVFGCFFFNFGFFSFFFSRNSKSKDFHNLCGKKTNTIWIHLSSNLWNCFLNDKCYECNWHFTKVFIEQIWIC